VYFSFARPLPNPLRRGVAVMKRIYRMWPDILISGFIMLLSTTPSALPSLRSISLAGLIMLGLQILCHKGSVSPVRQAYMLYFTVNSFGFWILPVSTLHLLTRFPASILYACLLAVATFPSLIGGRYFTVRSNNPIREWRAIGC
jgi:hypothetical protein